MEEKSNVNNVSIGNLNKILDEGLGQLEELEESTEELNTEIERYIKK